MKILALALGTTLRGDDGAGLALAEGLDAPPSLSFDDTGAQMFMRLERPRG